MRHSAPATRANERDSRMSSEGEECEAKSHWTVANIKGACKVGKRRIWVIDEMPPSADPILFTISTLSQLRGVPQRNGSSSGFLLPSSVARFPRSYRKLRPWLLSLSNQNGVIAFSLRWTSSSWL